MCCKKLVTHVESYASAESLLESAEKRYIKAINNNNNNNNNNNKTVAATTRTCGINSTANNQNNGTTSNNEPYDIIYNQHKEDNLHTKKNDLLPVASLTQRRPIGLILLVQDSDTSLSDFVTAGL